MNRIRRKLAIWWLHRRANTALFFNRPTAAIEAYRRMLVLEPSNAFAAIMLGNLLSEAGDRPAATTVLERLVQTHPDDADAWFNLGFLHDQADALAEAERCFRRATELKPTLDRAWYGLALILIRCDRLEEAVDALKQNVKLQPFSPYGYYQLGMTYHHLGRSAQAWKVHEQLSRFEPGFSATFKRDLQRTTPRMPGRSGIDSLSRGEAISAT